MTLTPCDDAPDIECGRLEVWENREAATGQKISIFVKVLRATGPTPAPDPLFYFVGGPGTAASDVPTGLFEAIRVRRDVVLVDQRGTGESGPLACPGWERMSPQEMLDPRLQLGAVAECRDALQERADLRHYTTPDFVDDVNDVRVALGYDSINIEGGSYGTRGVQVFLRRHPEHVRTATMLATLRMDDKYPAGLPLAGQQALDELFSACVADPACGDVWGDPQRHLETIMARFDDGPITVPYQGETITLRLEIMMEGLRHLMHAAESGVSIPKLLYQAAVEENYELLLTKIVTFESSFLEGDTWYSGLWLSVACSEDAPWITEAELERAAETVFGNYRPRSHVEACKLWPKGKLPAQYHEPIVSDTPTLLISGAFDPATPPQNGDAVGRYLSNSLHVVAREGHSPTDVHCSRTTVAAFIESGTVAGLDTSCLAEVSLPPWPSDGVELDPEMAETLAGTYDLDPTATVQPGWERVTVAYRDGNLYFEGSLGMSLLATPTSQTSFVLEATGALLDFHIGDDDEVEKMVLSAEGQMLEYDPAG